MLIRPVRVALVVLFLVLGAVAVAAPAQGVCGDSCGPTTWTSTLTVTPPAAGTVTSSDGTISCPAGGGAACTVTDSVDSFGTRRPTVGWPTYQLSWTGDGDDIMQWTGACSGTGTCSVANAQDSTTVGAAVTVRSTWTSTLTVGRPWAGSITDGNAFTCPSDGDNDTCSVTDTRIVDGTARPSDGWPAYTLAWVDPATGYVPAWQGGGCTGNGSCTVTNDQPQTNVTLVPKDVQAPTWVTTALPDRTSPNSYLEVKAADNQGVYQFWWTVCGVGGCDRTVYAGAVLGSVSTLTLHKPAGTYTVRVTAVDNAMNASPVLTGTVTLVTDLPITIGSLPAVTRTPSITFSSNDESHVADTDRWCRAVPVGTNPAWAASSPCTSPTTFAPALADGAWSIQVKERNDVGVVGTASVDTTVDTVAPAIEWTSGPGDWAAVASPAATFGFASTDPHPGSLTCSFDDAAAVPCSTSFAIGGLANGDHVLTVTATDAAGNTTSATRHFTLAVPTTLTAGGTVTATYGHSVSLRAGITPASATGTVRFAVGSTALCTATVRAGAATCTVPAGLSAGTRSVTATFSGNYARSSDTMTVVVKRAATALHAVAAHRSIRRNASETVTAAGLPSGATGTVTVTRPGHRLGHATVRKGVARIGFRAKLAPGRYTLTVRYGGNGNYAASVATVRITVTK